MGELVPLDARLAREAVLVRGASGLRTPDAIQVAAARLGGTDAIIANDARWAGQVTAPELVLLDDYLTRAAIELGGTLPLPPTSSRGKRRKEYTTPWRNKSTNSVSAISTARQSVISPGCARCES